MKTTRLYFGERFRFEFSPADERTPQLGRRERDQSGNHHFDYFVRAVAGHLQEKGIPADAGKSGSFFELLLDGKKDDTASHQQRIERECRAEATETAARDVWQRCFIPRLSSLENAAKAEADSGKSLQEPNAEEIAILMEMYRKSQEGKPQPKRWDVSAELETLREIRKQVERDGVAALFSEPVLKKLACNRRIPIKPLDILVREEADFYTRLRAEEELCEPEKYPIALDYRLCAPRKPGSVQVGDEHFEFPNLPVIVQMLKRCLPSGNERAFRKQPGPGHQPGNAAAGRQSAKLIELNPRKAKQGLGEEPNLPREGDAAIFDFATIKRQRSGRSG